MRHSEEMYYVGTKGPGSFGVREAKDPFITNRGKRWVWIVVIIIFFILSILVGTRAMNTLKKSYLEQTFFDTPEAAATTEIGKTMISLYAKSSEIVEFREDAEESARAFERYEGSDKAAELGWSGEELKEHFVVYYAEFVARYDRSKSVMADGRSAMYIYLIQDAQSGQWKAVDTAIRSGENVS